MITVCVIGLGYVGLPTAALLATTGAQVRGVDINTDLVADLNAGRTWLQEPGLATLIQRALASGQFGATVQVVPADVFIICVPTPVDEQHRVDLGAVRAATASVAPHLNRGNLVILESTSPINTTRQVVGDCLRQATGLLPGVDFHLCYCPERVLPGNTVEELVRNDRIVGGLTPTCANLAATLYRRFSRGQISLTDDRTAEMCKLMENTYRDVNIALANCFARIAEEAGVNVWKAIELSNRHPRVKILQPGPGVGGHCIPVDPWFLVEAFPAHTSLLSAARQTNDGQAERAVDRLWATGRLRPGDILTVLGVAYKADVDDARDAPALRVAQAAAKRGLEVRLHDPWVKRLPHGEAWPLLADLPAALQGAQAALLVTDHQTYRTLSAETFLRTMAGRLILDTRNWLDAENLRQAGFMVLVTGVT